MYRYFLLLLCWLGQVQAAPSLLNDAEWRAARDPAAYLSQLDALTGQDMELFHARSLAKAHLGDYRGAQLDNARARALAASHQEASRQRDFQLQQIALALDTAAPDQAFTLLAQLEPALQDDAAQRAQWHALNGLAHYKANQLQSAIAELKSAFLLKRQLKQESKQAQLQCIQLLITLGNLYADIGLGQEAEQHYLDALRRSLSLDEPNSQTLIKANMARLYLDMGRPARARQLLDSQLANPALSPDYRAAMLGYLAMALNAEGNGSAALRHLDQAEALHQQLGYPTPPGLLTTRAAALRSQGETGPALALLEGAGTLDLSGKALRAELLAGQGNYAAAYRGLNDYHADYRQHFNRTLSEHAAAFQAQMDLARSESDNHRLVLENERRRQQIAHQQSARNYQLMLVMLLLSALILLGITTHRLHRSSRRLYRLASFDQLTGLANRHALQERLQTLWQQEGPLSLIIIDIDHFKQINDQHGHGAGDIAIARLGQLLGEWAPERELIGRWGGEEFLVAIPLPAQDCWHLAEQLRQRVAAEREPGRPVMTISLGVAGREDPHETLTQLIHRADMAMYQAKRQGRNQTVLAAPPHTVVTLSRSLA
ncbi:GGDEF domain-containing protein [Aeromonas rivuli]|uniref:GGDEF domain-containing protein n=1 Tax=Aeromonas rivuli TaxID=648794 RepID=UPI002961F773|nr:GGDEF domain-containing protein [Aeromonas rivuli]UBO75861.1 diguanylate cyclase [Aeromonas rivuli]